MAGACETCQSYKRAGRCTKGRHHGRMLHSCGKFFNSFKMMIHSSPRVVVAIDLGTTFSGFAYARKSEPDNVFKCYDWPYADKAGARPYCKTQTSLFYEPGNDGKFRLKEWGWRALVDFNQSLRSFRSANPAAASDGFNYPVPMMPYKCGQSDQIQENIYMLLPAEWITQKIGYYATKFKLFLVGEDAENMISGQTAASRKRPLSRPALPGDLTAERLMVDYLSCISDFIMAELQLKYGKHFRKEDVEWCVTVPAIWDERAKQMMNTCAQKANIIPLGIPQALDIILEPEAASVYCQHKAKGLKLRKGDKLLVADVGGGTIDLVVHVKAERDPNSMKVDEAVGSYGTLGGGSFVDAHFFDFLGEKIGCFKTFCRENPATALTVLGWWQGIKMGFDGPGYSAELLLPRKLSNAWERYDSRMRKNALGEEQDYEELRLNDTDIMRIFDREVEKVVDLIEKQIGGVRVLMVVGGFSASPYLRKRIKSKFEGMVDEVIIPEDPGSAICHGAVQLHMSSNIIQSRISKRTYGISCSRAAELGDPHELVYMDDDDEKQCTDFFSVFVRKGERVRVEQSVSKLYHPSCRGQTSMEISLYSSPNLFPKFTTEKRARLEGSFDIDVSDGMELEKRRTIRGTMRFGASSIQLSAIRENFGCRNIDRGLKVTFRSDER